MNVLGSRVARWATGVVAAFVLALVMVPLLYTTSLGIRVVDRVPEALWSFYHRLLGLNRGGNSETLQNDDAWLLSFACLVIASGLVVAFAALVRHRAAAARKRPPVSG